MRREPHAADGRRPLAGMILVLYHPRKADLAHWLSAGRGLLRHRLAVDNAEEPDPALHARLRRAGLEVLVNGNRGGLAGAYNRGAAWLQSQDCELMFFFDQDSQPRPGFFEAMLAAAGERPGQPFILGAQIHERALRRYMPLLDPACRWPRRLKMDGGDQGLLPSLCVISSGSALSQAAWRRLGAFREDYFIEYIDIEYALRAWHLGVPVLTQTAAVLDQQAGEIVHQGRHYATCHPAWRRYYMARNAIDALRRYPGRRPLLCSGLLWLLYQALGVMRLETARKDKLSAMLVGLDDGWHGRLGRLEDRHPDRARRWRAV